MSAFQLVLLCMISVFVICAGSMFFDAWILSKKYKRPFKKILLMIDKRMKPGYGSTKRK